MLEKEWLSMHQDSDPVLGIQISEGRILERERNKTKYIQKF
jgi:hypothetical protein